MGKEHFVLKLCYDVKNEENKMRTAVITDTNSGISIEEGKQLGIYVLPMPVLIEDSNYLEWIDITAEQLYDAMIADKKTSTSQPAPGDLMDLWNRVLKEGYDELVYIPMSSSLSGSCQSAILFANDYEGKVYVVDNRRISVTQRESALQAKRMAEAGKSAAEIKESLEKTALDATIYLTVDSLKYLQKGGRLSASSAMIGTLLNIKPILSIQGEKIDAIAKVRGMKSCEKRMLNTLREDIETRFADVPKDKLQLAVAGTLRKQEDIDHWLDLMRDAFPGYDVYYAQLPCSIATHTGPDAAGIGAYVIYES